MQSSITLWSASSGRKARSVRLKAEPSPRSAGGIGTQFIDCPEIQVSGHEHLDTIALLLPHRRRDIDGALQNLRGDTLSRGRIDDDRVAAAAARLHRCLYAAVDDRDQHGRPESFPEVTIHRA